MRLLAALAVLAVAATISAGSGRTADAVPPNHVTIITDSVGGVLFWVTEARKRLARGLDLDLETKTCRKLVEPGCPAYGDPAPPSALDVVTTLGAKLGRTVVVDVGYNDRADAYGAGLDEMMRALIAAGVQHVVWVTLEEAQAQWAAINDQIESARQRWPQLVVADWARAPTDASWFSDGIHMTYAGGLGFADFLRPFVLQACGQPCAPPPPLGIATAQLPVGRRGKPYAVALAARGGVRPYRWTVTGLPAHLRLSADGHLSGTPRAAGSSRLTLRLRDAWDDEADLDVTLRVRR